MAMLEVAASAHHAHQGARCRRRQEIVMPYATARDPTRLYYEEAGTGSPILFLHEFAADYASWEPQMRYFSRRHRCIAYSVRGYTPSETPAADAFTYEHFRDDALAVLDHLGIEAAHLVGLSMGAYSSLQVGLISPERVLSLTLAGVGSGSEPAHIEAFRESAQRNARDFETLGSPEVAKTYGQSPNRIAFKVKDPRGFAEWQKPIAGRRAILPRGVPEDGVTASVRRVGSIQAVEGCGATTSPLDALAEAAAYKSWVSGRASCRLQRALPASRRAQISEKALF